jgi:hypothetical protein
MPSPSRSGFRVTIAKTVNGPIQRYHCMISVKLKRNGLIEVTGTDVKAGNTLFIEAHE